jgi:hypothetical protein
MSKKILNHIMLKCTLISMQDLRLYYGQEKNYLTFKKSEKITSAYK